MTHKILRRDAFKPDVYLYNLAFSDHGLSGEQLIGWLTLRMQHAYPGNYHVVRYVNADGHADYRMHFNDPKDKTMFCLRYS